MLKCNPQNLNYGNYYNGLDVGPQVQQLMFKKPGEVAFSKIIQERACRTLKIWLSLYQFFKQLPTHQYTMLDKKHPKFTLTGCFLQWFAQNTSNLFYMGSFISDEKPLIIIPNFAKNAIKLKAGIYMYSQTAT